MRCHFNPESFKAVVSYPSPSLPFHHFWSKQKWWRNGGGETLKGVRADCGGRVGSCCRELTACLWQRLLMMARVCWALLGDLAALICKTLCMNGCSKQRHTKARAPKHVIIHRQVYRMVPNFREAQLSQLKTHLRNPRRLCSSKIWCYTVSFDVVMKFAHVSFIANVHLAQ